jgi:pantetheine-phosphate adenylyltransferase
VVGDLDYELQMAQMNDRLVGVETMFMSANPSTRTSARAWPKNVARHRGDASGLVPEPVLARLRARAIHT